MTVAETTFALRHTVEGSPASAMATSSTVPIGELPERPELSEAECDIDTLKKLKLGLRSSLWSRPGGAGGSTLTHGDYSIAV